MKRTRKPVVIENALLAQPWEPWRHLQPAQMTVDGFVRRERVPNNARVTYYLPLHSTNQTDTIN